MILDNLPGWEWILLGAIVLIFFVISGVVGFIFFHKRRWPLRFEDYEDINGSGTAIRTRQGLCRIVGFGKEGEEILYCSGIKKFRPAYNKKISKNTYAFIIGQDGIPRNWNMPNIKSIFSSNGIKVVDGEVRMTRTAISKGLDKEYDTRNFMDKYGVYISFGILFLSVLAMGVSNYLVMSKYQATASTNSETAKANKEAMQSVASIMDSMESMGLKVNSGIVRVG